VVLEELYQYRFLYHNLDDLLRRYPRMLRSFRRIIGHKRAALTAIIESVLGAGVCQPVRVQQDALIENMTLQLTYWLSYDRLLHDEENPQVSIHQRRPAAADHGCALPGRGAAGLLPPVRGMARVAQHLRQRRGRATAKVQAPGRRRQPLLQGNGEAGEKAQVGPVIHSILVPIVLGALRPAIEAFPGRYENERAAPALPISTPRRSRAAGADPRGGRRSARRCPLLLRSGARR
jgi:hypothetical protein